MSQARSHRQRCDDIKWSTSAKESPRQWREQRKKIYILKEADLGISRPDITTWLKPSGVFFLRSVAPTLGVQRRTPPHKSLMLSERKVNMVSDRCASSISGIHNVTFTQPDMGWGGIFFLCTESRSRAQLESIRINLISLIFTSDFVLRIIIPFVKL